MQYLQQLHIDHEQLNTWIKQKGYRLASEKCAEQVQHPDWQLASGILRSIHLQAQVPSFAEMIELQRPYLNEEYYQFISSNCEALEAIIVPERDYIKDIFAVSTFEKGYLFKVNGEIVETIQRLYLRVACEMCKRSKNLHEVKEIYDALSLEFITVATPILANSGHRDNQMSSCYLLNLEDSLDSILETYKTCGMLMKRKGGLGLGIGKIRHSLIANHGNSKGIVPLLRCYNDLVEYVDQGGTRKGALTATAPIWHKNIRRFIELKLNNGKEELRARELHYSLWICDLFMRRVLNGEDWSLFCPNEVRKRTGYDLNDCWGEEFEELYLACEADPSIPREVISARQLLIDICNIQIQVSEPYIMFSDNVNRKSNQRNDGTCTNSNLCQEVTLISIPDKLIASCNLGAIIIDSFLEQGKYNYKKLAYYSKMLVRIINIAIEQGYVLNEQVKAGNDLYAPIGIGQIGLANLIAKSDLLFDSDEAIALSTRISACIYHAALQQSRDLAIEKAKRTSYLTSLSNYFTDTITGAYPKFKSSPLAEGKLQQDLWEEEHQLFKSWGLPQYDKLERVEKEIPTSEFQADETWDELRASIRKHGVVNATLLCCMPNASTAQLVGRNESVEPFHSNLYIRSVGSGTFKVFTRELVEELEALGLWGLKVVRYLENNDGSIKGLSLLFPEHRERLEFLEQKYRTGFELAQKKLIKMYAERGRYICMSQSFNLRIVDDPEDKPDRIPMESKLLNLHIYSWLMGQKTGMYYLHQRAAIERLKLTVDQDNDEQVRVCRRDQPDCQWCQ